jgi:hypothetical protein
MPEDERAYCDDVERRWMEEEARRGNELRIERDNVEKRYKVVMDLWSKARAEARVLHAQGDYDGEREVEAVAGAYEREAEELSQTSEMLFDQLNV